MKGIKDKVVALTLAALVVLAYFTFIRQESEFGRLNDLVEIRRTIGEVGVWSERLMQRLPKGTTASAEYRGRETRIRLRMRGPLSHLVFESILVVEAPNSTIRRFGVWQAGTQVVNH